MRIVTNNLIDVKIKESPKKEAQAAEIVSSIEVSLTWGLVTIKEQANGTARIYITKAFKEICEISSQQVVDGTVVVGLRYSGDDAKEG